MSYINLNVYEEIDARDIIDFVKSYYPPAGIMSDSDLLSYIEEYINTLVPHYLDKLGVEHGDIEWGDGIDELWNECVEYLSD